MHEFKHGELRSGASGQKVKSRRQAVAIALSEAGASNQQSPKGNREIERKPRNVEARRRRRNSKANDNLSVQMPNPRNKAAPSYVGGSVGGGVNDRRPILMNSAKRHPPSRREVMSAGTVGLTLASSQAALAQGSSVQEEREDLRDPQEIYPKPPFKRQSQPWPGLASKMDPRPDHGENTTADRPVGRAQGAGHRR